MSMLINIDVIPGVLSEHCWWLSVSECALTLNGVLNVILIEWKTVTTVWLFPQFFFPRQWFAFKFLKENIIAIALVVLPWTVWGNKHETEVVFRYQFAVFAIASSEPMAVVEQHLMLWPCWSVGTTTLVSVAVYAGNCAGGSIKFRALYRARFEVHQNESIVCCLCCCHYDTTNCCWNIFYFDVLWLRWPWIGCFSVSEFFLIWLPPVSMVITTTSHRKINNHNCNGFVWFGSFLFFLSFLSAALPFRLVLRCCCCDYRSGEFNRILWLVSVMRKHKIHS